MHGVGDIKFSKLFISLGTKNFISGNKTFVS